jgi:hypothetical protein
VPTAVMMIAFLMRAINDGLTPMSKKVSRGFWTDSMKPMMAASERVVDSTDRDARRFDGYTSAAPRNPAPRHPDIYRQLLQAGASPDLANTAGKVARPK